MVPTVSDKPTFRYRLEVLRHRSETDCFLSKSDRCVRGSAWCPHWLGRLLLEDGEKFYERNGSPALRGAFRKGGEAWRAGEPVYANPYEQRTGRVDRRGRYNAGFRAAFARAWEAGWAWAEYMDPDEVAMRAIRDLGKHRWGVFEPSSPEAPNGLTPYVKTRGLA